MLWRSGRRSSAPRARAASSHRGRERRRRRHHEHLAAVALRQREASVTVLARARLPQHGRDEPDGLHRLAEPHLVAEDAATLSLISRGRFDLGVGIGYRQLEFDQFGRKISHRPSLVEEGIEIIRRGWSGETVNFEGKRFAVGDLKITPQPNRAPKILLGGMAPPAIDRAARIADGFLCTGGIGMDTYVERLEANGKMPEQGNIILGCWAIIAEDPEAEVERVGDYVLYQSNEYIRWGAFGPPDQTPLFPDARTAIENGLYELWDADTAVEKLSGMIEQYPQISDIHFWAQFPGESVESGDRRMDYIAEMVLPRLR